MGAIKDITSNVDHHTHSILLAKLQYNLNCSIISTEEVSTQVDRMNVARTQKILYSDSYLTRKGFLYSDSYLIRKGFLVF